MIEPGANNFFTRFLWLFILLGALFMMFQLQQLPLRDLSQDEGLFAAVASEMQISLPMSIAHGVGIKNRYFLYPLLSSIISENSALQLNAVLRYLNFFFIAVSAALIGIIAGLTRDFKAGVIGAAFFTANGFIFMHSQNASSLMMGSCLLFAAQTAWIYFGFTKGHWNIAWLISLILVSAGFLTEGIKIPVYFFLPLFFMHRPLKFGSKINKKGFAAGMIILGAALLLWLVPTVTYSRNLTWDYIPLDYRGMGNFLLNIIVSPLQIMLLMLPWTLIVWMPFCAAIKPLDKTPIFSHYYRCIVITDFIFILFNPLSTMNDFIFTIPPLALLCAITYDTAVRRYSVEMRRLTLLCCYIMVLLGAGLILYCFVPFDTLKNYVDLMPLNNNKEPVFGTILAFLLLALWMYHYRKYGQLWLIMFLTGVCIGFFCHLTFITRQNADRSRSQLGKAILRMIQFDGGNTNAIIYKNNILDLYSESYYMQTNVRKINNFDAIDKKAPVIYLLTTNFPQYSERTWKNLYETTYRGQKLYLCRGETAKRKELISRRRLRNNLQDEEK